MRKIIVAIGVALALQSCSNAVDIGKIQTLEERKGIEGLSCFQLRMLAEYYGNRGDTSFKNAKDAHRRGSSSLGALSEGRMNAMFNKADRYDVAYIQRNCTD